MSLDPIEVPGELPPGFRVTAAELSDNDALDAMRDAVNMVTRAALEARLSLLRLGFADNHSLCLQLDRTAREYATVFEAVRRQRYPQVETKPDAKPDPAKA